MKTIKSVQSPSTVSNDVNSLRPNIASVQLHVASDKTFIALVEDGILSFCNCGQRFIAEISELRSLTAPDAQAVHCGNYVFLLGIIGASLSLLKRFIFSSCRTEFHLFGSSCLYISVAAFIHS